MSVLRMADRILSGVENFIAALALGGVALLVIATVVLRYTIGYSIFWAEEASIYLVIFSTFVGASITLRHDEHVNMDILSFFVGDRGKRRLAILAALLVTVYCVIIGGYGWMLVTGASARNTLTASLDLPLWMVQLSVPLGLTLMFVRSLQLVYRLAWGGGISSEGSREDMHEEDGR